MAQWLKASPGTTYTFQLGPIVDATDGVTPLPSETIAATAVRISKAGGAFASKANTSALTGTGDANGYYDCVLDSGDMDTVGALDVELTHSGALPVWKSFMVVPAQVYNSVVAGSDLLQADAREINGSTAAAARQALAAGVVIPGTVFDDAGTYAATNSGSLVFYSDDITEATADHYNGRVVIFTSGALLGQALAISDYEFVAATYGKFTCSLATEVPGNDATFIIV